VHIADEPRDFVRAIEACLAEERGALATHQRAVRQARIEGFLAHASWDDTWARAHALLAEALRERQWACRGS
jgi:hypothetical protein